MREQDMTACRSLTATISAVSWCCTHQLLNTLFEIYLI